MSRVVVCFLTGLLLCDFAIAGGPSEAPLDQEGPAPPSGYFMAPPQTGSVAAGTRSWGVDGLALHFPALSLKLPTLQLPSAFRIRTNARMLIDAAQAPFIETGAPSSQDQPQADDYPGQKASSAAQRGYSRIEVERLLRLNEERIEALQQELSRLHGSIDQLTAHDVQWPPATSYMRQQLAPAAFHPPIDLAQTHHLPMLPRRLPAVGLGGNQSAVASLEQQLKSLENDIQDLQNREQTAARPSGSMEPAELDDQLVTTEYLQLISQPSKLQGISTDGKQPCKEEQAVTGGATSSFGVDPRLVVVLLVGFLSGAGAVVLMSRARVARTYLSAPGNLFVQQFPAKRTRLSGPIIR